MRGGALPLCFWALLLATAGTLNAIWTGDTIQIGTFAAAVTMILIFILALSIRSRGESLRRGEDPVRPRMPEALPRTSTGAAAIGIGIGTLIFGLAFGHFPIYLGIGIVIAGMGRLAIELRAQRLALRQARGQAHDPAPSGRRDAGGDRQ